MGNGSKHWVEGPAYRLHGCQHAFQFYLLELSGRDLRLAFLIFQRLGTENEKARLHRLAFRVPPLGIEPGPSEPESEILSFKLQGHSR